MSACISCELELAVGARECPACGAEQVLIAAKVDEARCASHQDVRATGTCKRCGRFICVECFRVDADVCRDCVAALAEDATRRTEGMMVRLGWLSVVQGVIATALGWNRGDLFWLMAGVASFGVVFGLISVVRKYIATLAMIATSLIAVIAFIAMFDWPPFLICVALGLLGARLIFQMGPLERDAWHLRK